MFLKLIKEEEKRPNENVDVLEELKVKYETDGKEEFEQHLKKRKRKNSVSRLESREEM